MNVLVTGGAGYIGGHMVLALLDAGQPVVFDNLSTGFRWSVPEACRSSVGDVGDHELVLRSPADPPHRRHHPFRRPIVVPESVSDPLGYYLNNTVKTRSLHRRRGRRRESSNSSSPRRPPSTASPPTGRSPRIRRSRRSSPYGSSKLMTEMMLRDAAAAHGMRYVVLRYFNVAGADPAWAHRPIDGERHPSHQGRVADGARHAPAHGGVRHRLSDAGRHLHPRLYPCERPDRGACAGARPSRQGGESLVMNCGYGHGYTVSEVIETVRQVSGKPVEAKIGPRRAGDPVTIVADSTRIRSRLGWEPRLDDLATIVEHSLRWETMLRERNLKL